MSLFRQTWAFAGPQGTTWEEVYDVDSADDLSALPDNGPGVVANRMALAHPTVSLQHISNRDLQDRSVPPFQRAYNRVGTAEAGAGTPANANEAAVINLVCVNPTGTKVASRKLWMRGLSEAAVSRNATSGADVLSADFVDNLNRWFTSLAGTTEGPRRYGMLPRTRASWEGPHFRYKISSVLGNAVSDETTLVLEDNPAYEKGDLIQVNDTNRKILPGLRGPFTVVAQGVGGPVIRYRCAQNNPAPSGYVYEILKPEFLAVSRTRSGFAFLGARDTKKPVTRSRGRRSAVRLRR
jgi:hypothetical protein